MGDRSGVPFLGMSPSRQVHLFVGPFRRFTDGANSHRGAHGAQHARGPTGHDGQNILEAGKDGEGIAVEVDLARDERTSKSQLVSVTRQCDAARSAIEGLQPRARPLVRACCGPTSRNGRTDCR